MPWDQHHPPETLCTDPSPLTALRGEGALSAQCGWGLLGPEFKTERNKKHSARSGLSALTCRHYWVLGFFKIHLTAVRVGNLNV